ncbi:MAG: DUF3696 domain-containing protein [Candidatus Schekmanbacteria bacterium]|nr:DUF3696 domain-containing protein [Candidatus Schekmanbacteria bacterium]
MFKKLYLRNMKVWGDQLWDEGVEVAPVTLLLGANSAGKTSILQLPLLLKQTFESPDRHLDLNLGGQQTDIVDLGTYKDLIHGHDTSRELGLGIEAEVPGTPLVSLSYRVTYTLAAGAPVVQQLDLTEDDQTYGVERQSKGGYRLHAPEYESRMRGQRRDARRSFQPERSLMFSTEALAELGRDGSHVQDLALRVMKVMGSLTYLGPLRERPVRSYMWSCQSPGEIGSRGERAVHALLASANARTKRKEGEEGGQGWLVEKVSEWLARMGVADALVPERQGRSRFFEVIIEGEGHRANIMDVGFGVSQVLPLLVLAYFVPRGATIIAEQPEIHLHPRAQVGLAELMVEVSRERGVQFLVETHSEHIFRRLQFLIADQKLTRDKCRLYFVDRPKGRAAELRRLNVDDFGRVAEWPERFFGDAAGETERQMRRMMARLRAGEGRGDGG